MKASEISLNEPISFLFKGPFGFGKTLAAASFALEGEVHLAYWDKKSPIELITFFNKFGSKGKKILDNIEIDVYGSENANDYLNKLISLVIRGCRYSAMINDSITFMTASAVHWSQNFGKDPKQIRKIKDVLPDWDEWKVETNLISQCLDISLKLPCHTIWTAHPLSSTKIEGSGGSMRVTKVNPIVSYGSKVGSMIPGRFAEIYHLTQKVEWTDSGGTKRYIAATEAIGDEFAKSPLLGNFVKEFDFTDQLFYEVWRKLLVESRQVASPIEEPVQELEQQKTNNPFQNTEPTSKWKV